MQFLNGDSSASLSSPFAVILNDFNHDSSAVLLENNRGRTSHSGREAKSWLKSLATIAEEHEGARAKTGLRAQGPMPGEVLALHILVA